MSNIDKQANQVSRYDLVSGYMQKWPDGEFVYHSDYQALLDELEAKEKRIIDLEATTSHSNAGWKEAHEQEARAEAAEKRIAELEAREVKLTDINEYLAEVQDKTLNKAFRLLAEGVRAGDVAAMRAAGIHVAAAGKGE